MQPQASEEAQVSPVPSPPLVVAPSQLTASVHLRRAFVPSTPHSHGLASSSVVGSEDDRREKRARRFEAEQAAARSAGVGASGSGGSLMGRMAQGGSNPYWNNGSTATPEPENTYDPVSLGAGQRKEEAELITFIGRAERY